MSTTFTKEGHGEIILQKMWKRCENEELSDVVLIAGTEEKRIPAHRSVLSEASEYFNGMFSSSFRESTSKVVKMPDVNGDMLHDMLQRLVEYCYKGSVVISEDIAIELFKTAHLLLLADVVMACEKFLVTQLHPSNYLGFTILAEQYNCELLLQKAKEYSLENFMEICTTDEFLQLNVEQLTQLVASDDLVAVEKGVFDSLMAWMQHDSLEREQHKVKLLKLLRMPLLERSFLIEHVKPICTTHSEP